MIRKTELFPIGVVLSPHGINGEMSFSFTTDVFDTEDVEFFVFEKDGIFVPFFIESYRFKTKETALLLLDGIDSEESAKDFSGQTIYLPNNFLDKVGESETEFDFFNKFRIQSQDLVFLGTVIEVDRSTQNTLFVVEKENGDNLLLPANEDVIESIDYDKKIVTMIIPEGLLDL